MIKYCKYVLQELLARRIWNEWAAVWSQAARTFAIIQQLASGHLLTCISIREASQKKRFRTFSYTEHATRQPSQFLEEASLSIITFTYVLVVLHVLVFAFLRVLPSFSSHPAISWSSSVFLLIFPSNLFDHEPCSSFSLLLVRLFSRPYMSMPDFLLPFFVNLPIHCQYSHYWGREGTLSICMLLLLFSEISPQISS